MKIPGKPPFWINIRSQVLYQFRQWEAGLNFSRGKQRSLQSLIVANITLVLPGNYHNNSLANITCRNRLLMTLSFCVISYEW